MSEKPWPKWAEMNWLRLAEGPGDRVELPVAPTMRYVTHKGSRYFRMPDSRATASTLEGASEFGGLYLWCEWSPIRDPALRYAGRVWLNVMRNP